MSGKNVHLLRTSATGCCSHPLAIFFWIALRHGDEHGHFATAISGFMLATSCSQLAKSVSPARTVQIMLGNKDSLPTLGNFLLHIPGVVGVYAGNGTP